MSVHPPRLQQDTAQLLQDAHTCIQALAGEQLDPCKAPLKIPLLTCCEDEDEDGKDIKRQPLLLLLQYINDGCCGVLNYQQHYGGFYDWVVCAQGWYVCLYQGGDNVP